MTSWRAVSAPTQKSNGDLPRGPGRVTASPGRTGAEGSRAAGGGGSVAVGRNVRTALITPGGLGGGMAATADKAALSITGDIDLRWIGENEDQAVAYFCVGEWDTALGGLRSYLLSMNTGRIPRLFWSADGTAELTADATTTVPLFPKGTAFGLRATLDVDNGAAGRTITFYTSLDFGASWTQLGNPVTQAGVTSIFNGTAQLGVNGHTGGIGSNLGLVYYAEVRSGIGGTVVASPRFFDQPPRQPSFRDDQANQWSIIGAGLIGVVG